MGDERETVKVRGFGKLAAQGLWGEENQTLALTETLLSL